MHTCETFCFFFIYCVPLFCLAALFNERKSSTKNDEDYYLKTEVSNNRRGYLKFSRKSLLDCSYNFRKGLAIEPIYKQTNTDYILKRKSESALQFFGFFSCTEDLN